MRPQPAYFWLRTPYLSIESLLNGLGNDKLVSLLQDPYISDAIRIASPSFYSQLIADPDLRQEKTRQTALKYILRMGSRSTPFGLFAGYTQGQIDSSTRLSRTDRPPRIHRQLAPSVLMAVYASLAKTMDRAHTTRYFTNTSLYKIDDGWRYTEIQPVVDQVSYYLSQLCSSKATEMVLRRAQAGESRQGLIYCLLEKGYDESQATGLINQLIEDQVLLTEWTLPLTGPNPLSHLEKLLLQTHESSDQLQALAQINYLLDQGTFSLSDEQEVRNLLLIAFGVDWDQRPLFSVDIQYPDVTIQIKSSVRDALQKNLEKIRRLACLNPGQSALETFKERFYACYQEREMPLGLVLDPEVGLGYGTSDYQHTDSLLGTLLHTRKQKEVKHLDDWLLRQYDRWLDQGRGTLLLTDSALSELPEQTLSLPESYFMLGYFLADSGRAIDANKYHFVLKTVGGASSFNLLGRFCQHDSVLTDLVRAEFTIQQTAKQGQLLAEVAHLPHTEAQPVLQRPHLRDYEIPYLSMSTLPCERQIWLDDLYVSVPGGKRVVLRSKRLNKEILPRLTTAHNFTEGLPLYRFLGDLQYQSHIVGIQWNWGALAELRHLPRVQYGQLILQEARWRLTLDDYDARRTASENVDNWRKRWHWPRCMALTQADQELFLDMDSLACQKLLISTLKRLARIQLIEWLRVPEVCCVEGPQGRFSHEVIVPFVQPSLDSMPLEPLSKRHNIQQVFTPGSEWLYLKIYCRGQLADNLLSRTGQLANKLYQQGFIDHWFFIRYQDPEDHIRLRFHLKRVDYTGNVLSAYRKIFQPLFKKGLISGVIADTYQREIERYGSAYIGLMEQLFWCDSHAVTRLIKKPLTESQRVSMAAWGADKLADDFAISLDCKVIFYKELYEVLLAQQDDPLTVRKQLARQYRSNQQVSTCEQSKAYVVDWRRIVMQRSRSVRHILSLKQWQNCPNKLPYLASLIHLFVNRLFNNSSLSYELLVYHQLYQTVKKEQILCDSHNPLDTDGHL